MTYPSTYPPPPAVVHENLLDISTYSTDVLQSVAWMHHQMIRRNPADADWYIKDIARIEAELDRRRES